MFARIKKLLPVTTTEMRQERQKFCTFAKSYNWEVGNNEFGYYDDCKEGAAAWVAWRERAFEGRNRL